jgi:hypothetical protein
MQRNFIVRAPLKLPHQTFGEAFSSDDLTFDNVQTGHFMILAGNRVGEETGTAKITVDAIQKDGSVIAGIPFQKKLNDIFKYEEVTEDEIKLEECPVWREYRIIDRMIAKYDANRIRINISAVQNSLTPCCVIVEGTDLRYASEIPFVDENNTNEGDNQNGTDNSSGDNSGGGGTGPGDDTGTGDATGTGDDPVTGDETETGTGGGDDTGGGDGGNP